MRRDQSGRLIFGEALAGALVDTVAEVMAVPVPLRPQDAGFIMVTFQDMGAGDVVLSAIGLSLGNETEAYDNVTLDIATYANPVLILPFSPTKHANFTTDTVTLTFTPTAAAALGAAPFAFATVVEYPVEGHLPPPAFLGAYMGVLS